jgi:hypothetical protein
MTSRKMGDPPILIHSSIEQRKTLYMDRVLSNIGTVQGRQFATSILRLSNCELGKRVTSSRIDILFLVEDELR